MCHTTTTIALMDLKKGNNDSGWIVPIFILFKTIDLLFSWSKYEPLVLIKKAYNYDSPSLFPTGNLCIV